MALLEDDDEEEYEQPLVKRTKVVNFFAQNIHVEDVQEGARLITSDLLNQAMEKPYIAKVLLKQLESEVEAEAVLKEVEDTFGVGTYIMLEQAIAHSPRPIEEEK